MADLNVDTNLLAEINHRLDLREPNAEALSSVAQAVSLHYDVLEKGSPFTCIVDSATGVGKTYVMAGLIEYFAGRDTPVRNFLLLAPGSTIRDKSIKNFTAGHRKSITAAMNSRPYVITADNFKSAGTQAVMADPSRTKLFIFTVQALTSATGEGRATHEFQESLGGSLYGWLKTRDDLVVLADEHHCYRSPAFSKTIEELNPEVVVGVTATPDKRDNDLVVYRYPLSYAIRDQFVKMPVLVARKDDKTDDYTKLLDGVTLLRYKGEALEGYCAENELTKVNPVMLVIAQDTAEADAFHKILDSEEFDGGAWVDKTLLVHSNLSGDAKEKALADLDDVENPESPVRIIISVGMLREGWDVKNVYVIASMRASVSTVLTEQTLGRGMRLPFGKYTGTQFLDTVEVLAHERYQDLLKKKDVLNEQFIDYGVWMQTRVTESGETVVEKKVSDPIPDPVFPTPSGGGETPADEDSGDGMGDPSGEVSDRAPVQDLADVVDKAKKVVEKKVTPHEHLPIAGREPIAVPYLTHVENVVTVSLNQIPDYGVAFSGLAKSLSVDADDMLKRAVLKPVDGKIMDVEAEDEYRAGVRRDVPLEQSREELVDAVLSAPGVVRRPTEEKAAERIVDTIIAAMGDKAGLYLSVYMSTAKVKVAERVSELLTSMNSGAVTYSDVVEVSPLDKGRKCARKHQKEKVETFEKGLAYNGWTKGLYEYAAFDSGTEYKAAKIIDSGASVVVWARLLRNDIPITWTAGGQVYNPDFVVIEDVDGQRHCWLVETKANKDITTEEVTSKKAAAVTWANTVTNSDDVPGVWHYILLSETNVEHSHGNWEQMKVMHS
ncbi:MAG: DEAD/DEAH box helicase family protein [Microthrixaceae bacterium]|nr:DEAD/DEAH box helicase family protein [Microthrixaceae bacterium]